MISSSGPCPALIALVGDAPGPAEATAGFPFVGPIGYALDSMLGEAGISRSECFLTSVCRERPPGNDVSKWIASSKKQGKEWLAAGIGFEMQDKVIQRPIREGFELLMRELSLCKPKVIVTFGNLPMWVLKEKWGILEQRGSLFSWGPNCCLIPTIHPTSVLRQYNQRPLVVHDLAKAARLLRGEIPVEPKYNFELAPSFGVTVGRVNWLMERARRGPVKLVLDLETSIQTKHIRCCGLAWSPLEAICIPFTTGSGASTKSYWSESEEAYILYQLYWLLTHPNMTIIGQNLLFDFQMIHRWWGFIPAKARDTMIAAHSCFSTMPKKLDFLASLYGPLHYANWKGHVAHDSGKEND